MIASLGQRVYINGEAYDVTKVGGPRMIKRSMIRVSGEVYEVTRIVTEGDTRIVTAVPFVGEPITIRIGGSDNVQQGV